MPRQRVRRRLLRRLLVCAIQKHDPGWTWWAFLEIISYSFALVNCLLSSLLINCARGMKEHPSRRGNRYFLRTGCGGHASALQLVVSGVSLTLTSRLTKSRQASLRKALQMSQSLIHNTSFFSSPHWHWIHLTTLPMHPCLVRTNTSERAHIPQ